jgi:hypothetical protein
MTMINNFELIRKLLDFSDSDKFYFIQIFKRRKDNPELEKNTKVIDSFYVYSESQFDSLSSKIINLCRQNNARAYIRLNRRSDKKIALNILAKLATRIANNEYKVRDLYDSVAGETHSEENKTWVVDVDSHLINHINAIEQLVMELQFQIKQIPICHRIPTKTGFHLITSPFNIQVFNSCPVKIDIHKDSPTLLYCSIKES